MKDFPHVISIEIESTLSDGSGGYEQAWIPLKSINAFVQPISGKTFFQAQQMDSQINHKVFVPYDEEIQSNYDEKTNMRVIFKGGKSLVIDNFIDQGGLNEIMVLVCREGVME
jgi:SPP1 family predicted phage head-tail adaptor